MSASVVLKLLLLKRIQNLRTFDFMICIFFVLTFYFLSDLSPLEVSYVSLTDLSRNVVGHFSFKTSLAPSLFPANNSICGDYLFY